jgi:hypothetical protein
MPECRFWGGRGGPGGVQLECVWSACAAGRLGGAADGNSRSGRGGPPVSASGGSSRGPSGSNCRGPVGGGRCFAEVRRSAVNQENPGMDGAIDATGTIDALGACGIRTRSLHRFADALAPHRFRRNCRSNSTAPHRLLMPADEQRRSCPPPSLLQYGIYSSPEGPPLRSGISFGYGTTPLPFCLRTSPGFPST